LIADDSVRFAPAPTVIAFAFSLGAVLAAVLPTRREYAQFTDDRPPDAYSLAYLHVLTRANPDDEHLRLTYARHLQKLGRFEEALEVLGRAATPATEPRPEVENLRLELLLALARSIPEGEAARRVAFDAVIPQLRVVSRLPQSPAQLERIAELALELGDPDFAGRMYLRAAQAPGEDRPSLLERAGRWLRAGGDRREAAAAYQLASRALPLGPAARIDSLLAVETLESDDRACDAADLSSQLVLDYPGDPEVLSRAATLAEFCDRPYAARDYGRLLLALSPQRSQVVEQQLNRELAAGDVQAAFVLVEQLLSEHPDDVHLRELDAHVAEWSSHPDRALEDWMWLLDHGQPQDGGQ